MSTKAEALLAEFETLSPRDQTEVSELIWRQVSHRRQASPTRRRVSDVAGKFRTIPNKDAKEHDRGFAESIQQPT